MAAVKKTSKAKSKKSRGVTLLVGTRKGAWFFHSDAARKTWRVEGPHLLGNIVNHVVRDTRLGHDVDGGEDGASGADDLSLDR